ncbi:MAG: tRNA (adenosine(37)-N6)-dimethylallyltransferase MiaA [Deltaproteobacteria bacterium]|nr:MAG: tRNA (adenosine(37)-N6)-dimethylallyltransferase MiaA [Deltaproteobacteria bacterium]
MAEDLPKLVIISGPTCSGKSVLAVALAELLGGEIINADSMQVYRGMDIGTAKLPMSERKGIPHHLIDIVNPDREFNAALFSSYALPIIQDLHVKKIPIIVVGGTGLYVKALLRGLFECPPSKPELRKGLWEECEKRGPSFLYQRLSKLDSKAADSIHPMDKVRIIRALEVIHLTGCPFSELAGSHGFSDRRFLALNLGLNIDRQVLYSRINRRTMSMIDSGFVNEVEGLLKKGYSPDLKPMKAIGYRHIVGYLEGTWDIDEATRLMQRDTRRYAKRQITWFRADPEIIWVDPAYKPGIINKAMAFMDRLDL